MFRRNNKDDIYYYVVCVCIYFSPCDARLSRVVKEPTLVYEFAQLGFEDTVKFVRLASLHILMVVKVHHFHCCYVL